MNKQLPDIKTENDIRFVVSAFYKKVMEDESISGFFSSVDWEKHLPLMSNFWSSLMFQKDNYFGYPFQRHQGLLNLKREHFLTWLKLFNKTIDEHFAGEQTEIMKEKAGQIAEVFALKLGINHNL